MRVRQYKRRKEDVYAADDAEVDAGWEKMP